MGIFSKKKPQKRIINTGKHLPEPSMSDYFELHQNRGKLVLKPIFYQSRRDKTILYGAFAVNQLVGQNFKRSTYDIDVYSNTPKKHAIEIEKSIDQGVNADFAYVEQTAYPMGNRWRRIYRVKTRASGNVEADYNKMPKNVEYVKKKGVRYEKLNRAERKYKNMLKHPELGRSLYANIDLDRIKQYKKYKR